MNKEKSREPALHESGDYLKELRNLPSWSEFVDQLTTEVESPPSEFTKIMLSAAIRRLSERFSKGMKTKFVIELGAKEAAVSTYLSKLVPRVIATEVDLRRIELIRHNIENLQVSNVRVVQSVRNDWFPRDVEWHSADMILANPPSVPTPPKIPDRFATDRAVLFSGPDGRSDIGLILAQARHKLAAGSDLIIVGADYVLDSWLESECSRYGMAAIELERNNAISRAGELDWEISDYVRNILKWDKFRIEGSAIGYDRVAYSVFRDQNR